MTKFKYFGRYRFLLILSLFSWISISIAQNAGDFRTKKSGLWDSPTTWELYNGSTWQDSISVTPGQNDNVYIQNNHSVTLTRNEGCKNLNLHTGDNQNRITTSSYSLSIFGKLRAYTGNVPGISTTALPITENWINTSGGGRILIEGNSRNITESGEWGMNPIGWRMEIALNPGETGIFNTGVKAAHFIISSGTVILTLDNTFRPDSGVYGSGTITIQSGATLRLKAGSLQRLLFPGPNAHFARLDVNGTLAFDSSVVGAIAAAVINFNGKVEYSANGAQTFVTRGANSNGAHPNTYTNVELNGTGIKTLGLNTTINGTLKIAGESGFSLGSYSLTYGGSSTVEYAGSIAQTTSSAELPASGGAPNLTIDNINGVTLHDSRTVTGNLTLSNGTIITGLNTLSIGGTGSVTRNNGHVAGKLEKQVPAGSPVLSYEIGDINNYTPLYLAFYGVTTGGSVTAEAVGGDHPEIGKSKINEDESVNRYWMIENNGVSFSTSDAVFNFVSSDINGGADTDKFIVEKYDAPDWTSVNVGARSATSTAVTGITSFSDFAIGEIKKYTITATAGLNGMITPSGDVEVSYGENQQFIITPDTGYYINDLLVDGIHVDSTVSYTFYNVKENHTIEAQFSPFTFTIVASAGPNGTIIPSGNVTVNYGSDRQFTVTPDEGYKTSNLIVDGVPVDSTVSYTFYNIKTDHTIEAQFEPIVYTITASSGLNGSIIPSGSVLVQHGNDQQFIFTPDDGYYLDSLFVDGIFVDSTISYTFYNVKNNHTINALFAIKQYTIAANAYGNGTIVPSGNVKVNHGDNQAFQITPNPGHQVTELLVDGLHQDSINSFTFFNVTENHTIDVYFGVKTFTLALNATNGTITKNPDQQYYDYGTSVEITAIPADGYTFTGWTGDTSGTENPITIIMNSNKNIGATFALKSYTITSSSTGNGSIIPNGTISVNHGDNITFIITPDIGNHLDSLIVDNLFTDSTTSYTFYNVVTNHTIRAVFKENDNPVPILTRIEPAYGYRGETKNILFIGSNFISGVTNIDTAEGIQINNIIFNSTDTLTVSITILPTVQPGQRFFSVTNSPPGGGNSSSVAFDILNNIPAAFNLISPADGDTIQLTTPPAEIMFSWSRSTDADINDTIWYELIIQELMGDTIFTTRDTSISLNIQGMLNPNTVYHWFVNSTDGYDTIHSTSTFIFRTSNILSADENNTLLPTEYALNQNYPNPFNPSTTIKYELPKESQVSIKIFNLVGQEIAELVNEFKSAGRYSIRWDAVDLPSGIYFYRITADKFIESKKMILIK